MKPILFNTEMVKAILQGRKTVTRRLVKPQPLLNRRLWELGGAGWSDGIKAFRPVPCHSLYNGMPYKPGDVLWVRETWNGDWCDHCIYKADGGSAVSAGYASEPNWHPSIHMPREAARIFLCVTDVRVERLQEITAEECICEGVDSGDVLMNTPDNDFAGYAKERFAALWDGTVKPVDLPHCGWDANPWVWVIGFERYERSVTHD